MTPLEYFVEAVECGLDEAGCFSLLTKEQISVVARVVEMSHENIGQAFGYPSAPSRVKVETVSIERHQRELADKDRMIETLSRRVARDNRLDESGHIGINSMEELTYSNGRTTEF